MKDYTTNEVLFMSRRPRFCAVDITQVKSALGVVTSV